MINSNYQTGLQNQQPFHSQLNLAPILNIQKYVTSPYPTATNALKTIVSPTEITSKTAQRNRALPSKACYYLDFENLYFGLKNAGLKVTPEALIAAVQRMFPEHGLYAEIHAFADWQVLSEANGKTDVQRALAKAGVKTHYVVSKNGKNSSDMAMANDIRTRIDRPSSEPDSVSTIVVGSGDRDFMEIIRTAIQRGKHVIVIAISDGISSDLAKMVEVRYLDQLFDNKSRNDEIIRADDGQFSELVRIAILMRQKNWKWVYQNRLYKTADTCSNNGTHVEALLNAKFLKHAHQEISVTFNMNHPDAFFAWWIVDRLHYLLNIEGRAFVNTTFLANGMAKDPACRKFGIGQTRLEAAKCLKKAENTGHIISKLQPLPKDPEKQMKTWLINN